MKYSINKLRTLWPLINEGSEREEKIKIILGLPIKEDLKVFLLRNEDHINDAPIVHNAFVLTNKINLAETVQKLILVTPKLRNNAHFICDDTPQILTNRKNIGINTPMDMVNHILLEDKTGVKQGCGCKLCLYRHKKYVSSLKVNSYFREQGRLDTLGTLLTNVKDPFSSEFFNKRLSVFAKEAIKTEVGALASDSRKERLTARYITGDKSILSARHQNSVNFLKNKLIEIQSKHELLEEACRKLRILTNSPF